MMRFFQDLNAGRQLLFRLGSVFGVLLLSGTATAWQADVSPQVDSQATQQVDQADKKRGKASEKLSGKRIAELLGFVQEHHPDILPLLKFLKEKRRKKFDKVMKGLDRDLSKLERTKKKSIKAYQRGLDDWINQSKIQLYAAQYRIADEDETAIKLREEIQLLVGKSIDSRIAQLEREREGALAKAERLQKAIEKLKAERSAIVQKRIAAVTKNALVIKPSKERGNEKAGGSENATVVNPEQNIKN